MCTSYTDIFSHITAYLDICDLCVILTYLGPEKYSESCLLMHIHAYSCIFNNDSYNCFNFSLLLNIKQSFKISAIIEQIKLSFFSKNKFCDRKESNVL